MKTYTDKFYFTRTHTELCKLVTDLTGVLHTVQYSREELIAKHKELINGLGSRESKEETGVEETQ